MTRIYMSLVFGVLASLTVYAQEPAAIFRKDAVERVFPAPEKVFKMFRDADMDPVDHKLTEDEKAKVEKAFSVLPSVHQEVLKKHLHSISFMDNMPNTALTSPVDSGDSIKIFNITFRAGIFNETISQWATAKENTCYERSLNNDVEVTIDAGELDAFLYVLLHEATHVVDAVLQVTPHPADRLALVQPTPFTESVWEKMNIPAKRFIDSLLQKTFFRSGKKLPVAMAPDIYKALAKTPFVSLYAMASWFEDVAELETIYHLTTKMKQPFFVIVKKDKAELLRFEPMRNGMIKKRLARLQLFYKT